MQAHELAHALADVKPYAEVVVQLADGTEVEVIDTVSSVGRADGLGERMYTLTLLTTGVER